MRRTRTLPSSLRLFGLVLCGLLLSACSQEPEVVTGPFIARDGLIYHQDTSELVTGTVEEFHFNGQLQVTGNWVDGERDGLFERLDQNGQVQGRENYVDGELDGLWEWFDEDGNLIITETYRNGEVIETNENP